MMGGSDKVSRDREHTQGGGFQPRAHNKLRREHGETQEGSNTIKNINKSLLPSGVPRTATERGAWAPFKLMGGLFGLKSQKAFAGWGIQYLKVLS
jgi:hypothetical protein